jgi:protein SCO1/2
MVGRVMKKIIKLLARYRELICIILFLVFVTPKVLLAGELNDSALKIEASEVDRDSVSYVIPDVAVIRQDGKKLSFSEELNDGRPVLLNFVFVSCSAICPMLSHVFSKVQAKLAKDGQKVHLISISIDPESDTPEKLTTYAKKFGASSAWDYYSGTREISIAIQKAFNVFKGDKMNHGSVVFIRAKPGKSWLRLEGIMSPDLILSEYRKMIE